jgi:hypothetical protein
MEPKDSLSCSRELVNFVLGQMNPVRILKPFFHKAIFLSDNRCLSRPRKSIEVRGHAQVFVTSLVVRPAQPTKLDDYNLLFIYSTYFELSTLKKVKCIKKVKLSL